MKDERHQNAKDLCALSQQLTNPYIIHQNEPKSPRHDLHDQYHNTNHIQPSVGRPNTSNHAGCVPWCKNLAPQSIRGWSTAATPSASLLGGAKIGSSMIRSRTAPAAGAGIGCISSVNRCCLSCASIGDMKTPSLSLASLPPCAPLNASPCSISSSQSHQFAEEAVARPW